MSCCVCGSCYFNMSTVGVSMMPTGCLWSLGFNPTTRGQLTDSCQYSVIDQTGDLWTPPPEYSSVGELQVESQQADCESEYDVIYIRSYISDHIYHIYISYISDHIYQIIYIRSYISDHISDHIYQISTASQTH